MPGMETTRASLLLRIRDRGDASAWRDFDTLYRPLLYRFALARGLDHSEAEDVVQHAMIAIQQHISGFDYDPTKGRFKSWLRTIVNNRVRNLLASRHERPAESQDFKRPDSQADSPEALFDQVWMREHLEYSVRCIQHEVEPETWLAFEAYALNDESADKVCRRFNLNPNQLYSIKFRLTKMLSAHMSRLMGEET